ncbi:xylanase [Massilia sp. W12]|uniref:xylanase n=1 Tax=Massilia sp. W12 TaxID=3126507 RepID=UPI0030D5DDDE
MPKLVLKIDVDTWRGTQEGVPALMRMLQRQRAGASFLFSLGPDHTGWAMKRALRPGFFSKVSRTSVLEHYGLKTLMYGVLLPGPDIGAGSRDILREVYRSGFECGIHCWDHVRWQDNVRRKDEAWTRKQMDLARARFAEIFLREAHTHGAAGWQMNSHALALEDEAGMRYASDSRARLREDGWLADPAAGPHRLIADGRRLSCVQLPTTLPTLDELLGVEMPDGAGGAVLLTPENIAAWILRLTAPGAQYRDHVYTLHAELEGQKLSGVFLQLLQGWQEQGYHLTSMRELYEQVADQALPEQALQWGELPGRSGEMLLA